ncbi:MAG: sulfite reductase (NADPH) hemoprotein beta-component [Hyphomicrobiaceae bacterium]|jgi:sulfite reductase (NADPH) hemoprotein beta-component
MYQYEARDQLLVEERARQFRRQVARRIKGDLLEDEFKPLRLQNGLYMQLHAYMLRIAVPYGALSSEQLRKLAYIGRTWDRGYGHFTTRQNIQFNWIRLEDVPVILDELASVQMHAIQTSGNCIRNTTSDPFAGVTPEEVEDPRPWAEIIRQWSTLHPEFAFLPRKFKIAVNATQGDERTAVAFHDIGLQLVRGEDGQLGFQIMAGGGLGRSPFIGSVVRDYLPSEQLLCYLEAILRVYNRFGRRDNKYKARIKILVSALGIEEFSRLVEKEWEAIRETAPVLADSEVERVRADFRPPDYAEFPATADILPAAGDDRRFSVWLATNVHAHKRNGYRSVTLSLKEPGTPPGDASDDQMDRIADLADRFGFGELRVTHTQNLVLPDVAVSDLRTLYDELGPLGLANPNRGRITDTITCPGLDFCALANARSIPVALEIMERFEDLEREHEIGEVSLKISGCINACGHHHIGNLGILGIDKQGEEYYQLSLGGSAGRRHTVSGDVNGGVKGVAGDDQGAAIGKIVGPAFPREDIVGAVETVLTRYLAERTSSTETFLDCYRRVGDAPFKEALYGSN